MWTMLLIVVAALAASLAASRFLSTKSMPVSGSAAPDFSLNSQDGTQVSLKDFRGKWVVLYFYPKDFTSGCTIEAHNFERDKAQYDKRKAAILGVSVDTVDSHQQFCTKESLTFKLLADPDKKVVTRYGSTQQYGENLWAARNTFLIDPQGMIRQVFTKVKPDPHSAEVLAALDQMKK